MLIEVLYILLLLSLLTVYAVRQSKKSSLSTKTYGLLFSAGWMIKCFGAILLSFLFQPFGDCYDYFQSGLSVIEAFEQDIQIGSQLFFLPNSYWSDATVFHSEQILKHIRGDFDSFSFAKLSAILTFIGAKNIYITAGIFGTISHLITFNYLIKYWSSGWTAKLSIFSFYTFPSLVLWSNGILKDTVAVWAGFFILFSNNHYIRILGCAILLLFKPYLLILGLIVYLLWKLFEFLQERGLKWYLSIFFICMTLALLNLILHFMPDHLSQYNLDNIARYIYNIENWNTRPGQNSAFHFGLQAWTPIKMIYIAPISIFTTLFRPFLWESKNFMMLIMSLESLLMLIAISSLLYQKYFQKLNWHLVLSILLSYWLGITTFNFGALSRYKTILFLVLLFSILAEIKKPNYQR